MIYIVYGQRSLPKSSNYGPIKIVAGIYLNDALAPFRLSIKCEDTSPKK